MGGDVLAIDSGFNRGKEIGEGKVEEVGRVARAGSHEDEWEAYGSIGMAA